MRGGPIMEADLLAAIGTVSRPPEIERRIAVHEAGHAVITTLLRPEGVVGVRIGSGGAFAGLVETTHDTRSTRESIHGTLLELLAGRAAEEVVLGGLAGSMALKQQVALTRKLDRKGPSQHYLFALTSFF